MDLDLLREFLVLSKSLNYSKAAASLYISQSVLSRHIQNLEAQLGVFLFERSRHSVVLTPVGKIFANDIEQVLHQYSRSLKHLQMARDGIVGELEIATSPTFAPAFVFDFLTEFHEKYPEIKVNVSIEDNSFRISKDVINYNVDFAVLVNWPQLHSTQMMSRPFFKDHLYVIAHEKHPIARTFEVTVEELSGVPMIYLDKKENICATAYFLEFFAKYGSVYNASEKVDNLESLFFKIITDNGISIVSEYVLKQLPDNIRAVKIINDDACLDVDLIWNKESQNVCSDVFIHEFDVFVKKYNHNNLIG